jgi:hypothetical protein
MKGRRHMTEAEHNNIVRACEASIDPEFGKRLERMVGFRNPAVHRYQELNLVPMQKGAADPTSLIVL